MYKAWAQHGYFQIFLAMFLKVVIFIIESSRNFWYRWEAVILKLDFEIWEDRKHLWSIWWFEIPRYFKIFNSVYRMWKFITADRTCLNCQKNVPNYSKMCESLTKDSSRGLSHTCRGLVNLAKHFISKAVRYVRFMYLWSFGKTSC